MGPALGGRVLALSGRSKALKGTACFKVAALKGRGAEDS